jgi:hypothetical protein
VVRIRPCPDIIGGNLVQFIQQFPLAGKHTAAFGMGLSHGDLRDYS